MQTFVPQSHSTHSKCPIATRNQWLLHQTTQAQSLHHFKKKPWRILSESFAVDKGCMIKERFGVMYKTRVSLSMHSRETFGYCKPVLSHQLTLSRPAGDKSCGQRVTLSHCSLHSDLTERNTDQGNRSSSPLANYSTI